MISVLRELRLSYAVLSEGRRTRLGTATASLRPRPDRRVTRRLCRHGSPRPGEAGRWDVESRVTGLATALRSRGRARPDSPIVDELASNSRCPGSSRANLHADARAPSR